MQFQLDETQQIIRESARRLLSTEFDSNVARSVEAGDDGFSTDIWAQLAELGWNSIAVPEAAGGGGLGVLELCVLAEELGRAAASTPLLVSSGLAATCLRTIPSHPLAAELLEALAGTDSVITAALIDPSGRDERSRPGLVLRESDDELRITGVKQLVPYASAATVMLVTTTMGNGETAIVAVDGDARGLSMNRHDTLGADPLFEVRFDDIAIDDQRVLARGPAADEALEAGLEVATVIAMAEAVGFCESILEHSVEHARDRQQFGQPIGTFQAVAHPLTEMRIQIDAFRFLMLEAAWLLDQGRPAQLAVASAKVLANDAVDAITVDGHRVHGAIGYSMEHDVQLYTRRARAFSVAWGDTERQVERAATALGL